MYWRIDMNLYILDSTQPCMFFWLRGTSRCLLVLGQIRLVEMFGLSSLNRWWGRINLIRLYVLLLSLKNSDILLKIFRKQLSQSRKSRNRLFRSKSDQMFDSFQSITKQLQLFRLSCLNMIRVLKLPHDMFNKKGLVVSKRKRILTSCPVI